MSFIRIKIAISVIFLICGNFYIYSNVEIINDSGFDFLILYQIFNEPDTAKLINIPFKESKKIESNENNKFELEFLVLDVFKSENLPLQFSKDNFCVFDGDRLEIVFDYNVGNFFLFLLDKEDLKKQNALHAEVSVNADTNFSQKMACISNYNFEIKSIKNISESVDLFINVLVGDYLRDFFIKAGEVLRLTGRVHICKINDFDDVELDLKQKIYDIDYIEINKPKKLILKYKVFCDNEVVKSDFYAENHFR